MSTYAESVIENATRTWLKDCGLGAVAPSAFSRSAYRDALLGAFGRWAGNEEVS